MAGRVAGEPSLFRNAGKLPMPSWLYALQEGGRVDALLPVPELYEQSC